MNKIVSALYVVGGIMALLGAAVFITGWTPAPYIYTIGACMFALAQINLPYHGSNKNIKRLRRQQILGALFLVVAGALMFFMHNNEWVMALSIGSFIQLYTAFRIPQERKIF
ncbi:MAG: hypothetical protein LBF62_06595 [Tannerellaceae bacterium]|jgi:hypothetical protein|nr:hypothetical protein [Tannerellaceae bacterium]